MFALKDNLWNEKKKDIIFSFIFPNGNGGEMQSESGFIA